MGKKGKNSKHARSASMDYRIDDTDLDVKKERSRRQSSVDPRPNSPSTSESSDSESNTPGKLSLPDKP